MSNRFHNKWHRKNHHTYGNASNPDAAHDPIASQNQPFLGEFVLQGALCAVAPMSAFAGYFYSNFTGLCAFAGYRAIQAKAFSFPGGDSIGLQVDSQNIAISAYAPFIGLNSYSMTNAISAYGKGRGAFIGSDIKGAEIQGGSIGAEVYSTNKAISANGFLMGAEIYSNRRAISAYGSLIGAEIYGVGRALSAMSPNLGIEVYSNQRAISAYATNVGIEVRAENTALSASSTNLAGSFYANNRALSAYGTIVAGEFRSPNTGFLIYGGTRGLSAYSGYTAAELYGAGRALSAMSPNLGIEVYSNNRAISAYGTNIGAEVASPNVAISAYSPKIAIRAYAPIYTQNNDGVRALDVRGFSFFDGDVTISGNLTAAGALTYLDTKVQITSSLYVKNAGTDTAFTVIQSDPTNSTDIVNIQDDEATALYVLNGGNVGIGTNAPAANLHVVDIRNDSHPEVRIQARTANTFDPTLRLIGIGDTTDGLTVRYDSNIGDVYINNGANPSNNIAYRVSTAADTDAVVVFNTGNVGINAITPIDAAKLNIAGDSTSSNIALSARAPFLAGSFYGLNTGLSANGSNIGAVIRSPNLALRVTGGVEINNNSAETGTGYPVNINNIYSVGNVNIGNSTGNLVLSGNRFDLRTENPVFINTDAGEIFNLNTGTGAAVNINTGSGSVTTQIGNAGTVDIDGTSVILNGTTQVSINTNAGTAVTNIGTGSTTGTVSIGDVTATVVVAGDTSINASVNDATNINTGTSTGTTTIGNVNNTTTINSATTNINSTVNINAGPVNFPSATSAANGLVIGEDTNLYRSAANILKTDDSLVVQTNLTVNGNSALAGPLITPAPVTVDAATKTVATTETSLIFTNTNCTVTLPSAATYIGRWLFFKNVTANSVISNGATDILPLNSSTPTNAILEATAGKWAWLQSDGTYWVIMAAN